ncbi:hypothetical protein HK104_002068 [Borealophlyctis nickersoniae]|nr:hypothetical protein HK104_002068 [Borealophlyctis nickersoniae]
MFKGGMDDIKGHMKEAAGHVTRNKGETDEGRAMEQFGDAEKDQAKGSHAFTRHGERKDDAKAASEMGEAQYYDNRAQGESLASGRQF